MDTQQIYQQAQQAQQVWAERSVSVRLSHLHAFRKILARRSQEISVLLEKITGKVPFEALTAEILTVLDSIAYWEKHAKRQLKTQKVPTPLALFGRRSWVEYRPRGVVLVIAPWNYPLQLSLIPTLSALVAGNAVVLKPSEVTQELDSILVELFVEAKFPAGLVQVISGDGKTGADLVAGEPDLIFFTGSVATGKVIQKEAAPRLIPTILELGGKDPFLILDDANLKRAVAGALWGGFTNSGQVCLSTERIFVHQSLYQEFFKEFRQAIKQVNLGQMTTQKQVEIVKMQISDAVEAGASLTLGEGLSTWEKNKTYLEPSLLTDLKSEATILNEETFGPVVTVQTFQTDEEAIELANATRYGLGASVWSQDLTRAENVAKRLVAGNISINDTMITVANPYLPFGGLKESGLGSYHGADGLRAFCNPRAWMASQGKWNSELNWFPYTEEKTELVLELIQSLHCRGKMSFSLLKRALNPRVWFFLDK